MSRHAVAPVYVVADPEPRTVHHSDSPQERLNRISAGLIAPISRLDSDDPAIVLNAAADIVRKLAKAGLNLDDLADKLDSDPSVVWFPVTRIPVKRKPAKSRVLN